MVERVTYAVDGWGVGEVVLADGRLAWHEHPRPMAVYTDINVDVHLHTPLLDRFRAYFSGAVEAFADVELELDWCTPFQHRALEAMRSIPYGETATYGEVAALAGHPNAGRAIGSVCAANRFALVVPCHRVVAADGLGAYGSLGLGYKRRLLELEGVVL
jgi:methylated-DNA-[protein]-cysteine S-methyltransferase